MTVPTYCGPSWSCKLAVIVPPHHEAHYVPSVGVESSAVKKDDGPAPGGSPVQIVEAHSRHGNFAPLGEHNFRVDA